MIVMDKLSKWTEEGEALMYTFGHQFTVQQKLMMGGHLPMTLMDPDSRGSFLFHLRNAVKMVVERHDSEFVDESVWEPCVLRSMTQEEAQTVYIRGKRGLKRDGAGRPVMELVFETRLFVEMLGSQLQGRQQILIGKMKCNMAYTNLLHELLVRNSTLTEPSQWQKQTVQKFPAYTPSFLTSLDSCGADALGDSPIDEAAVMEKKNVSLISLNCANLVYKYRGMPHSFGLPESRSKQDMKS